MNTVYLIVLWTICIPYCAANLKVGDRLGKIVSIIVLILTVGFTWGIFRIRKE